MSQADALGTEPIPALIRKMAIPAAVGILVLSIYGIVDTIFVGRWVGSLGIGAITVVLPIMFLISSIGMAIGIGGASIISRALGEDKPERANLTFGNQLSLTLLLAVAVVIIGSFFQEELLQLFGGKGQIFPFAKSYFQIILIGIPFLAFAMMSNNIIRAEGKPKIAMFIMIVPAVVNLILDPLLIAYFDMGIRGAAWATTISYIGSASYAVWFFASGRSELKIQVANLTPNWPIVKEIFSIGSVTLARQGTISILSIVLNNTLFNYGGELGVSVYGIINRMMMFANFPVLGITQGFLPIAGFNYGAKKWKRVKEVIKKSILYGSVIAFIIFVLIFSFSKQISQAFTTDIELIAQSSAALVIVFLATPTLSIQLIGSAYYQAIGRALPALFLSLLKQGICLIPLIIILPQYFGLVGIWYAFPIADLLTAMINFLFLRKAVESLN